MSILSDDNNTYVKASCLCKSNQFYIPFSTAKLPQNSTLCQCSICRHTTGQLGVEGIMLDSAPLAFVEDGAVPSEPAVFSNLSEYSTSTGWTRLFCTTCGAYMFGKSRLDCGDMQWALSTGALEKTEGIVRLKAHAYVKSTKDGGLSNHYRAINGVELPRFAEGSTGGKLASDWKDDDLPVLYKKFENEIHAHCQCKKISFRFSRPTYEESMDPSKWWIIPGEEDLSYPTGRKPPRFFATHCFCSSCRLSHSSTVSSCILVPRVNIFNEDGSTITLSPSSTARPKNFTQYNSSPDTYREFCSTCGAGVFWWTVAKTSTVVPVDKDSQEPVYLSVSAGLMNEEEGGALSEGWASWGEVLGNPEDAVDQTAAKAVQEGVKRL